MTILCFLLPFQALEYKGETQLNLSRVERRTALIIDVIFLTTLAVKLCCWLFFFFLSLALSPGLLLTYLDPFEVYFSIPVFFPNLNFLIVYFLNLLIVSFKGRLRIQRRRLSHSVVDNLKHWVPNTGFLCAVYLSLPTSILSMFK